MASNFKVSTHRNSENVHLKLIGDFDEISANHLIDVLEEDCKSADKVFIHTNSLTRIHPFGCNLFHHHLNILERPLMSVFFTGDHANRFVP